MVIWERERERERAPPRGGGERVKSKETVGNSWTVLKVNLGHKSSQSLNEIHIYRLQPNSATKGEFFHIFLSLIVSSWRHGLHMANEADEVLLGKWPR